MPVNNEGEAGREKGLTTFTLWCCNSLSKQSYSTTGTPTNKPASYGGVQGGKSDPIQTDHKILDSSEVDCKAINDIAIVKMI